MKFLSILFILLSTACIAQPEWETFAIPMSDGEFLAADVYLPNSDGTYPIILIQTPYNKDLYHLGLPLGVGWDQESSDYGFVILDWRCRFASMDACAEDSSNGQDGYDAVEWIAGQDWCDGNIGTYGPSALATVQYQTAAFHPPHLRCCVPEVGAPQQNYFHFFPGGIAKTEQILQLGVLFGIASVYASLPYYNFVWQIVEEDTQYADDIEVPMLLIGGWYDINTTDVMRTYSKLLEMSPVAEKHKLLMGPWVHGGNGPAYVGSEQQGELTYLAAAGANVTKAMQFFDYYMQEIDNGWEDEPKISFFQTNTDQWVASNVWPPANAEQATYYFQLENTLSTTPPQSDAVMAFNYDPEDPSPTIGGQVLSLPQGPFDLSEAVETRNDLLLFSLPVEEGAIDIAGDIVVRLQVSSDRLDTDFIVRLTDVFPEGSSYMLNSNCQRMRFLEGYTLADENDLIPGEVYDVEIILPAIAYTFSEGHKLRILISSSNYPQYNRNMNNGDDMYPDLSLDTLINPLIAHNSLHIGPAMDSYVILPIVSNIDNLAQIDNSPKIHLFPNPVVEALFIRGLSEYTEYTVIDMIGKVVLKGTTNASGRIDTNMLESGSYILCLSTSHKLEQLEFIKQ
jgi:uncharacterized protein